MSNKIARADAVGSLLRHDYLNKAKERMQEGGVDLNVKQKGKKYR